MIFQRSTLVALQVHSLREVRLQQVEALRSLGHQLRRADPFPQQGARRVRRLRCLTSRCRSLRAQGWQRTQSLDADIIASRAEHSQHPLQLRPPAV